MPPQADVAKEHLKYNFIKLCNRQKWNRSRTSIRYHNNQNTGYNSILYITLTYKCSNSLPPPVHLKLRLCTRDIGTLFQKKPNSKTVPWTVKFLLNYRFLFSNSKRERQVSLQILRLKTSPRFTGSFVSFSSCNRIHTTKDYSTQKEIKQETFFLIIRCETVCPQTTEGNHKGVTDQRETGRYYLLSLSELSLVLRCLWRFILTHPEEEKKS